MGYNHFVLTALLFYWNRQKHLSCVPCHCKYKKQIAVIHSYTHILSVFLRENLIENEEEEDLYSYSYTSQNLTYIHVLIEMG